MTTLADRTIAIVGLGLLGGSLAAALKRGVSGGSRVVAWARRAASLAEASERGWIDFGSTDPARVLPEADLTVLCIPPVPTIEFVTRNAVLWRTGSLVTDVGSVKAEIVRGVRPVLAARSVAFVGSHPMAGSERTGIAHADPELFAGATVFLTPTPEDAPETVTTVADFWQALGARPFRIEPDRHDALTARTSHVLHLLAAGLVRALLDPQPPASLAAAGAFRDMTRVASSSPDMWTQIARQNGRNIIEAFDRTEREIAALKAMVRDERWEDLKSYLENAGERRREWDRRRIHLTNATE
ncbi:MAG: prephenate dehydrogenase [Kiritimatiellaeota bacterium]|nr:prephenate dehydrogenase [Kiritimatiellota bacterium]